MLQYLVINSVMRENPKYLCVRSRHMYVEIYPRCRTKAISVLCNMTLMRENEKNISVV